jgi:hypothetical protein
LVSIVAVVIVIIVLRVIIFCFRNNECRQPCVQSPTWGTRSLYLSLCEKFA